MSRITQVLNRHLRPLVLNTVRSLNGLPVPSDSVDVMAYESDSQACHVIETEPLGRELIPARALSGDPILVEETLEMMPDLEVQEKLKYIFLFHFLFFLFLLTPNLHKRILGTHLGL